MKPTIGRIVLTDANRARFLAKVAPVNADGCRLWTASLDSYGYGQFAHSADGHRRTVKAHLVALSLAGQPFPPGLEPDHLCNNRACTTVAHLEWVTHDENCRRMALRSTHCRSGLHRWDEQTPIRRGRGRECRHCRNASKRRSHAAKITRLRLTSS